MNISYQREVVLTENNETHNPITVDIASVILKFLCCFIGIPLNFIIAFTICHRHRLQRKPRNFFLLGITLSYLSFFIPPAIELIYWSMDPMEPVCHAYVAVVAVPQGLLLINMLLALTDRYFAINYPLLHQAKMTTRMAICLIIPISLLTIFLMKFVYIVRLGTLRCEVWLVHVKMMTTILIILFASCIVSNIIIYRQTKTLLRESRTLQATQNERDPSNRGSNVNNDASVVNSMCIHVDRERLCEIEMETTRTLMIGVVSLCVMPCLALIFIATFLGCRLIFGQVACSSFLIIVPFLKELCLTPAVYGPVIFLARNKELRAAWT